MVGDYLLSTSKSFEAQPGAKGASGARRGAARQQCAHCVILESRIAESLNGTRNRASSATAGAPTLGLPHDAPTVMQLRKKKKKKKELICCLHGHSSRVAFPPRATPFQMITMISTLVRGIFRKMQTFVWICIKGT